MMRISVAVPVRNEASNVGDLLRRLLAQTRPPDEIIITDGGSIDGTPDIVAEFISNGAPIKLIRAGEALPGRGRNLAAAEASSEWLAFIDGGIEPAADWLEVLANKVEQDSSIDVVYGAWEPVTDSFFAECAAITYVPPPALQGWSRYAAAFHRFVADEAQRVAFCRWISRRSAIWRRSAVYGSHRNIGVSIRCLNRAQLFGGICGRRLRARSKDLLFTRAITFVQASGANGRPRSSRVIFCLIAFAVLRFRASSKTVVDTTCSYGC